MIKPCTFFRLIPFFALFVIPNLLRANGEPTSDPNNGKPVGIDSLALKLGHCDPITIATVNCTTKTIELSAFISYLFTGQQVPFAATWSTGEIAQKITVIPPGVWNWDPIPTGCNEPAHYDNEYNQPGRFFYGTLDILGAPLCQNGLIDLTVVPTDNVYSFPDYSWNPASSSGQLSPYEVTQPGLYQLTVTDQIGCTFMDQINVSLSPAIVPTLSGPLRMCPQGDTAILQVNQPWNAYLWNAGQTTNSITVTEPGLYNVTVTNQFGCTGEGGIGVQSGEVIAFPIFATSPTLYPGQVDTLRVIGGYSQYSWSNGPQESTNIVNTVGTYTVTVTNSFGCTGVNSITIGPYIPPPWTIISTSRNHTIIIPDTLKFEALGGSLQIGDQIGVFYDSAATGILKCGGYAVWSGLTLVFPAYGNDATAPSQNGFNTGELFKVKFWRAGTNQIFDATAQYAPLGSLGGLITRTNDFADDGISMITALTEGIIQSIPLINGWNMISSYINPGHPDMLEVFDPIASSVDIIKDGDGKSCIPIIPINVIGNWNLLKGYQVRANQKDTLQLLGHKAVPEASPIPLYTGWQIIGYLRDSPKNIATVFSAIQGQISLVKNNDGKIYSPQFGINTIGNMLPGQGYKVKALSNTTLLYQPNFTGGPVEERNENTMEAELLHFVLDSNLNTGNNATIILTDSIAKSVLAFGDEIGVFTPAGVLCGAAIYKQENLAITVWGDDPSTSGTVEGMKNAEAYKFRVWDISEQKECIATTTFLSGINAYSPDAFEVIQTLMFGVPTYASITAVACSSYVLNNQTYSSSGIYTQILTNVAGCDSTITLNLTINPVPTVTVNNPSICPGQTANLTASGATTYLWSTGATTNSITVSPSASNIYTVTGTNVGAGCISTPVIAQVTVNPVPSVTVSNSQLICSGQMATLTANGAATYLWSNGETTNSITVSPIVTTTYTVSGTTAGCTSFPATIQVTVNQTPTITVNSDTICLGQPAILIASGAASYLWSNGETTNSITVSPNSTTTYTVTGTEGSCNASTVSSVIVDQLTIDLGTNIFLPAGDSVILDATCTCEAYQWSTGETTSTIVVYALGIYTVTVSNEAGCTATDNIVIMTTSTSDTRDGYSISVSPNPTNNLLSIRCHGASTSEVQVFDNLGKVVLKDNGFVLDGVSRTISLKTLPAGSYFLRIVGDGFVKSVPVIKN